MYKFHIHIFYLHFNQNILYVRLSLLMKDIYTNVFLQMYYSMTFCDMYSLCVRNDNNHADVKGSVLAQVESTQQPHNRCDSNW